ncbi:MAG: regulatory protein RecX [Dehalococcoidia bacterium]
MDEPPSPATIVEIRGTAKGRMRLIRLSDGRELLVSDESCVRSGAQTGAVFTEGLFEAIEDAEQRVNTHEAALRLLSHRARSENEMRTRLRMRGFPPEAVDDEVVRLREAGLLDDGQFARAWVEDRKRTAPRGRKMLRYELLGRGIAPSAVDEATDGIDDQMTALNLARGRARGSALADYDTFMAKVGGFLRRRGFDWAVVAEATRVVWAETGGLPTDAPPTFADGD